MTKIGRNAPCHCGSGRKYKKCCLAKDEAPTGFTRRERESARAKLERFSGEVLGQEDDDAFDEFWGEDFDKAEELDEGQTLMSEDVLDMWFWFDRPLADGSLVVDRLLAEDSSITDGERSFLELARGTCMRFYQVIDTRPGAN